MSFLWFFFSILSLMYTLGKLFLVSFLNHYFPFYLSKNGKDHQGPADDFSHKSLPCVPLGVFLKSVVVKDGLDFFKK